MSCFAKETSHIIAALTATIKFRQKAHIWQMLNDNHLKHGIVTSCSSQLDRHIAFKSYRQECRVLKQSLCLRLRSRNWVRARQVWIEIFCIVILLAGSILSIRALLVGQHFSIIAIFREYSWKHKSNHSLRLTDLGHRIPCHRQPQDMDDVSTLTYRNISWVETSWSDG